MKIKYREFSIRKFLWRGIYIQLLSVYILSLARSASVVQFMTEAFFSCLEYAVTINVCIALAYAKDRLLVKRVQRLVVSLLFQLLLLWAGMNICEVRLLIIRNGDPFEIFNTLNTISCQVEAYIAVMYFLLIRKKIITVVEEAALDSGIENKDFEYIDFEIVV